MDATEVERLLARIGGEWPPAVAREANQLLRKLAVKMKPGTLGKHEVCRPAVAVELACRVCHHHAYPRAALVAQSMVKEAVYKDVLRRAEQALDLRAAYTPRQLAVVLGGEPAADLAERLLRAYEPRYRDSLHESRRQPEGQGGGASGSSSGGGGGGSGGPQPLQEQPALVAAAFFLATKKLKIKVDRKRLQEVAGVQTGELNNVINSMQDLCTDLLGGGGGNAGGAGGAGGRRLSVASRKRRAPGAMGPSSADENMPIPSSQDSAGGRFSLSSDASLSKRGRLTPTVRQSPRSQHGPGQQDGKEAASQGHNLQQQQENKDPSALGGGADGGGKDGRTQSAAAAQQQQQRHQPQQRRKQEEEGPRLLRFKTEEERALYEGWKRAVLEASAAKQQKRRRSSAAAGDGGKKKKKAKTEQAAPAASQASAASSQSSVAQEAPAAGTAVAAN